MNNIEKDPIIGRFLNTAEKKAKWLVRIKIAYLLWLIFLICGTVFLLFYYLL